MKICANEVYAYAKRTYFFLDNELFDLVDLEDFDKDYGEVLVEVINY